MGTPQEAVDGAHALVVLTEWDEFKTYPYHEFYAKMTKPACVFDGRSILDHKSSRILASRCTQSARAGEQMAGCVPSASLPSLPELEHGVDALRAAFSLDPLDKCAVSASGIL